jgi:hypothetical protein
MRRVPEASGASEVDAGEHVPDVERAGDRVPVDAGLAVERLEP